jgi:hypothetical protein
MAPDPFDPAHVGNPLTTAGLNALTRAPRRASLPRPATGQQYLGGPIPLCWLSKAAALPGKALHLGVALWYAAGRSKGKNPAVKLTSALATQFGVGARTTRSRALEALKRAGLVSVEDRVGRTPLVTILPTTHGGGHDW